MEELYADRDSSLRWDLRFRDEDLENEYRRRTTPRLCTMAAFPYLTVVLYSVYSICLGSIFEEDKTVLLMKWGEAPVIAAYVSCWIVVGAISLVMLCLSWSIDRFRSWRRAEVTVATTVAVIIMLRVFLGNRWRVARLVGDDPAQIFGAYSQDTELLLNHVMAVAYFGMYTPMRFRPFLLCCCVTSLISFGTSTAICGSPSDDNWIRDFALCIVVVVLLGVGQRELEKTHRQSWQQQELDKDRIARLEDQSRKHKEKLQVWNEEQEFMRSHLDALSMLTEPAIIGDSTRSSLSSLKKTLVHTRERYSTGLPLSLEKLNRQESSFDCSREEGEFTRQESGHDVAEASPTNGSQPDDDFKGLTSLNSTGGTGDVSPTKKLAVANVLLQQAITQKSGNELKPEVPPADNVMRPKGKKHRRKAIPNKVLASLLQQSKGTRWDLVKQCVRMLRNPYYSLKEFHEHVTSAFPELEFYRYMPGVPGSGEEASQNKMSSSRSTSLHTAEQEYQRTIGALYSIYWLMRLDMNGKLGFCFGHSEDSMELNIKEGSQVPSKPSEDVNFFKMTEEQKRANFYHTFPWDRFTELFQKSGCLTSDLRVCEERCEAMLALTAIHDIFKNEAFLPTVAQGHSFEGYTGGHVIQDHDQALNYILVHYPDALPSFAGLTSKQRKAVAFTQGKMGFNNGWLVQAEAPPHALFSTFKELIASGGATDEDVSFYFVHWLTDLAGAVPSPLSGSEQFVLKFPDYVLAAFLRSFSYVWSLATRSETEVYEDYLVSSWVHGRPDCPVPTGEDAIAIMRLFLQAQRFGRTVVRAFHNLDDRDKLVLTVEMNKSGIANQAYSTDPCAHAADGNNDAWLGQQVPAILIYYGPAMLQNNIGLDEVESLRALAEVYRAARSIWPLEEPPEPPQSTPIVSRSSSGCDDVIVGKGLTQEGASTSEAVAAQAAEKEHDQQADDKADDQQEAKAASSTRRAGTNVVTVRIEQLKDFVVQNQQMDRFEGWFLVKKNAQEGVVERQNLDVINDWNCTPFQVYRWLHI